MRVKLQETPQELRRRVANKLESIRGTPMAPGGDGARLGEQACPIYRPDVKGVAYWEFEIAGLKKTLAREHEGRSSGLGFMLASTGRHDIPIPHWSLTIEPPSRALEAKAPQGNVARIIKLDTLAYAAEGAKGRYLAHLGQFPLQIVGTRSGLTKLRGISTVTATPKKPSTDDLSPSELIVTRDGVRVPKLKLAAWESWPAAKRGYAKAYKPHLEALAARAADAWTIEDLIAQFGEGIHEGQRLTVPLLKDGKAEVTGNGAKLVKLTFLDRQSPAVTLEALPSEAKTEADFQLAISYSDGTSETLLFFVVPKDTPSNNRSTLPHFAVKSEGGIRS
jgi:hypothetical protein